MTGPRRFHQLVLITGVMSVLAFSVADRLPLLAMLVVAAAFIGSVLSSPLPRITLNFLVLAATANAALAVLRDRQELIGHLTTYLSLILVVKIFDRGRMRDEAQLLGLSIFIVIGSVLTGQSFLLGILLVIYTVMAMTSIVMYQVYAGRDAQGARLKLTGLSADTELEVPPRATRRQLAGTICTCLLLSLAAAIFSFIVTPRGIVQQFIGNVGRVGGGASTGYRDNIQLGQGGFINVSREPVMDVVLRDDAGELVRARPEVLYLRGAVLTHYDKANRKWTDSAEERSGQDVDTQRITDSVLIPIGSGRQVIRQEISIRNAPSGRSPAFAAYRPIRFVREGNQSYSFNRADGLIHTSASGRLNYRVDSLLDYRVSPAPLWSKPDLHGAFKTGEIARVAAQLAEEAAYTPATGLDDPGVVRRLATTIIADLRKRCTYSLENPPPGENDDPLEFFLFTSKKGHCEYFACAMVALLQSNDVEARVVTGYAASEFNPVNDHYTVRQSDAHAWVEVRIAADRWETFDPTPPGELQAAQRATGGLWGRIRQAWDALEFSWIDNVVAYDRGMQVDLLSLSGAKNRDTTLLTIRDRINATLDAISELFPAGTGRVLPIAAILLVGITATVSLSRAGRAQMFALWRRLQALFHVHAAARDDRFTPQTEFYRRLLSILERSQLAKPATTPPLLHAEAIRPSHAPLADLATDAGRAYYRVRFGGRPLTADERIALDSRLSDAERTTPGPAR
ncbi:MAG: DUF3488 and transglutaminase-like domain-containing protein [Phycisphaerales bacterium]